MSYSVLVFMDNVDGKQKCQHDCSEHEQEISNLESNKHYWHFPTKRASVLERFWQCFDVISANICLDSIVCISLRSYIISTQSVFGGELGRARAHESKVLVEDCLLPKDEQNPSSIRKVTAI